MAVIVEDGSIVADANAFVTVDEARAFSLARASTVLDALTDTQVEAHIIAATDFIQTLEKRFQGSRVDVAQMLSFPRSGVSLYGFAVAATAIPEELKSGQCQLVLDLAGGVDLLPVETGREVLVQKVDVIETEYAPGSSAAPVLRRAFGFLEALFKTGAGGLVVNRA